MPCLELSVPKLDRDTKATLAASLTAAFCAVTGHPAAIFGIRFLEYAEGEASLGGRLYAGPESEPYLHMLLYSPRLKRSVKQKLASALTEAFTNSVKRPDWKPFIHLCEHPYDNVAVEGKILTDAFEELAGRRFYYELPKD